MTDPVTISNTATGVRGFSFLLFGNEILQLAIDAKWFLLFLLAMLIADFRFGWGESHKRYYEAQKTGDSKGMEAYRWHVSRAIRRSCNKFIDYIVLVLFFTLFGMALLEPLGYSHVWGTYVGCAIAFFCEIMSICGHFFYLRGVTVERKSIFGFFKAFLIALTKKKNEDIGDALETAMKD